MVSRFALARFLAVLSYIYVRALIVICPVRSSVAQPPITIETALSDSRPKAKSAIIPSHHLRSVLPTSVPINAVVLDGQGFGHKIITLFVWPPRACYRDIAFMETCVHCREPT